jgi:SAM-dependent methyltransferase
LFTLEAKSPVAAEETSKGCQVEASLERALGIPEMLRGFDIIYLGNGLQRFREPRVSLRTIAIFLNPGGFLSLITPNLDSAQRKLFGPAWMYWQPEEHRFIYNKKSLTKLLAQAGFSLSRLQTLSDLESTKLSLNKLNDHSAPDEGCVAHSEMLGKQAERIARNSLLFWDKLGRGDEILALFRRVS